MVVESTYILEVLLFQDGEEKPRHLVVCIGGHVESVEELSRLELTRLWEWR